VLNLDHVAASTYQSGTRTPGSVPGKLYFVSGTGNILRTILDKGHSQSHPGTYTTLALP